MQSEDRRARLCWLAGAVCLLFAIAVGTVSAQLDMNWRARVSADLLQIYQLPPQWARSERRRPTCGSTHLAVFRWLLISIASCRYPTVHSGRLDWRLAHP